MAGAGPGARGRAFGLGPEIDIALALIHSRITLGYWRVASATAVVCRVLCSGRWRPVGAASD
jgi:hypothetical protein